MSDRVRASVRVFDGFARAGDSEFTLVLSGMNEERARATCERVRASLAEPIEPLEGAFLLGHGVDSASRRGTRSKRPTRLKRARAALAEAREAGGDMLRFA